MEQTKFYANSLHHIDLTQDEIHASPITEAEDLNDYIKTLVRGIRGSKNNRRYRFKSKTTQVFVAIKAIIDKEDYESNTQIIASRLLNREKIAQEKIKHMKEIQKGSLLQSYLNIDSKDFIIITKVDHNAFIDEFDLKKKIGLPFEKKVLKSCIVEIFDNEISKVIVYDTQATISKYWWQDFLELEEIVTDEQNTRIAFKEIDSILTRKVKKQYPADHIFLRNALVGYFRTQSDFDYDELLDYMIGVLEPDDSDLNIDNLKTKLINLPGSKNFDRKFSIISNEIKARQRKRIIELHENIDLNIKSDIEHIDEIIKPHLGEDNKKYLMIQSDQGYYQFKRNKKKVDESD